MRISFSVLGKIGVFITLVVSLKAWLPIVCRPSLKLILVILEQLLKAQSPILSTVLGIVSSLSIDELLFVKEALMSEIWYSTSLYLNFPPLKSNPDGAINSSTLVISTLLFSKILKENLPPCTLLSSILADTPLTSLLEEQLFNVLIANIELEIATIDPKSNEKIFTFLFISRFTNVINRLLLLL